MRLWVDRDRPPLPEFHDAAQSGEEAIAVLGSGKVTHVSIAHDLAGQWTGFSVLCWMRQNDCWPRFGVHVHGGTREQRTAMEGLVWERYRRYF